MGLTLGNAVVGSAAAAALEHGRLVIVGLGGVDRSRQLFGEFHGVLHEVSFV